MALKKTSVKKTKKTSVKKTSVKKMKKTSVKNRKKTSVKKTSVKKTSVKKTSKKKQTGGQPTYKIWQPSKSYNAGDIISYNNINYICTQSHNSLWKELDTQKEISNILKKKLPNELVSIVEKNLKEYKSIKSEDEYKGMTDTIVIFKDEFREKIRMPLRKVGCFNNCIRPATEGLISDHAVIVVKYKKKYYQMHPHDIGAPDHFGMRLIDYIRSYGSIKNPMEFIGDMVRTFDPEYTSAKQAEFDAADIVNSDILNTAVEWAYRIDLNDNTLTIKGQPKDFLIQKTYPLDNIPTSWVEQITPHT